MYKKYKKKKYEKDLLEEILNKHRKKLKKLEYKKSQQIFQNKTASYSHKNKNYQNKSNNIKDLNTFSKKGRAKMSTVFKSIGYRKSYDSLGILMRYFLKNAESIENEIGDIITNNNIVEEFKRFELIKDEDNLKDKNKIRRKMKNRVDDECLKNRQIWHSMFSLPNNLADKETFKKVMQESLDELFIGHKYMFVIHGNTEHYHCHIVVKTKNDLTKKQIRINPQKLNEVHKLMHKKCIEYGIDIETKIKKETKKKKAIYQRKEVRGAYHRLNNWKEMYKTNTYPILKVNKITLERLQELGMTEKNINSFLNMYKEDKKLAIWSVNKNPRIFSIKKPKEAFTLRKVKFMEGEDMERKFTKDITMEI